MLASLRLQLAAALEFAACIRLRFSMPDLPRAYKIPLGSFALGAMLSVPIGISLFVCYTTASQSYEALAVIGAGLTLGLLLYVPFVRLAPDDRLQLTIEALSRQGSAVAPNPVQGALLKQLAIPDTTACGCIPIWWWKLLRRRLRIPVPPLHLLLPHCWSRGVFEPSERPLRAG